MVESMLSAPPSSADEPCSERPTLAAVARAAHVSLATASYALRGDPKISCGTRQRICAIAKQIGYTPNPELGRLMFMLRERHRPQIKATLALLTLKGHSSLASEFGRSLLRGMRERATALGFALDAIEVDPGKLGRARLTQILLSRGVRGVILAPLGEAVDCSELLDWEQFSAVATTSLVRSPQLARVTPHHFQIAELTLRKMAEAGHRRIAWVMRETNEETEGAMSLAAHVLSQRGGNVSLQAFRFDELGENLTARLSRRSAEAILVDDSLLAAELTTALRGAATGRAIYALNCAADHSCAGVFQNPETVGQLAVEVLARSIQSGERGQTAYAAVTMIEGAWVNSTRDRFNEDVPLAATTASA